MVHESYIKENRLKNMKIALLAFSTLQNDPRPRRMLGWMQEISDEISYIGLESDISLMNYSKNITSYILEVKKRKIIEKIFLGLCLLIGFHRYIEHRFTDFKLTLNGQNVNLNNKFDLIVCSDLKMLPFAFKILKKNGRVFFDAREYYPKQYEDRILWFITIRRFNIFLCKKYLNKVDVVFTVGKGLQKAYKNKFDIDCKYLPSYSELSEIQPKLNTNQPIKLLYHGNSNPSRGTDILIEIMDFLPGSYQLDLMLMIDFSSRWGKKIKKMASQRSNVNIRNPVSSNMLIETGNDYDIGLVVCRPSNFNLVNGMPNKFFEYIQSKLCIVCGIQKEMGEYIDKYNMGINVNSNDPKKIAEQILNLDLKKINEFKKNVDSVSKFINSDSIKEVFLDNLLKKVE